MVKAIKITTAGEISEVDDVYSDEDYQAMQQTKGGVDSWCLSIPEQWEHDKFKLSMTTLGFFEPSYLFNQIATILWAKLRNGRAQDILGTVFMFNETGDGMIDFTKQDFGYIMEKITGHATIELSDIIKRRCNFVKSMEREGSNPVVKYIGEMDPENVPEEQMERFKALHNGKEILIEYHLFDMPEITASCVTQWRLLSDQLKQ